MTPTVPIELDAITLRPFTTADFEQFYAYRGLPEVARYVRWPPNDREDARTALDKRIAGHRLDQPGDTLTLAIIDRASGRLAGEVMLAWPADYEQTAEIGFALHPDFHGQGLAHAAAREMLRIAFDVLKLHRVTGFCDPRNGPSAGLLGHLGLRQEGHLHDFAWIKGEWTDELIFAMLDHEWRRQLAESPVPPATS